MKIKARRTLKAGDYLGEKDLILEEPDGKERLLDPVHWVKYARKKAKELALLKRKISTARN